MIRQYLPFSLSTDIALSISDLLDMARKFVHSPTMIKLNIHEAKTHLSKYLTKLKAGERIVLCKRNQPVAQITPLSEARTRPRPIGLAKQTFSVPVSFFEPLPEDLYNAFESKAG